MKTDRTEHDVDRTARPPTLEMPRQAPPIDRTGTASAGAYGDAAGVEADNVLESIMKFLQG
ncbi:hypothetical protein ACIRPT_03040 [Streptomyces sp. NPDC101227]|uniref:hypothetical protein n=1 Tax=Streptomyces sp. NPDC101227 TaxID=3366136 RepID=UPI0037FAE869